MISRSISSNSQPDWDRLRLMKDEDIDLSEIPEVTAQDLRCAVLRLDGKPILEDKLSQPPV